MGDELGRRNNEYLQKQILALDSKLVFLVHAKNILYEQSLPPVYRMIKFIIIRLENL